MANCFWPKPSCVASTGLRASDPMADRSSSIPAAARPMPPTGTRARSRRKRGSTLLCPGARRMHRQTDWLSRSDWPAVPARPQHRHRRYCLGNSATWSRARQNLDRRPRHRRRSRLLRPAERRLCGRRSADRQNGLALPDQRPHESLAHDLRVRRQPVRGDRRRPEYPLLRPMTDQVFSRYIAYKNALSA
jgi:hypothetical protein